MPHLFLKTRTSPYILKIPPFLPSFPCLLASKGRVTGGEQRGRLSIRLGHSSHVCHRQCCTKLKPRARSSIQAPSTVAGTQVLGCSSTAVLGTTAQNWIRRMVEDAGIPSRGLTRCNTKPTPTYVCEADEETELLSAAGQHLPWPERSHAAASS